MGESGECGEGGNLGRRRSREGGREWIYLVLVRSSRQICPVLMFECNENIYIVGRVGIFSGV